MSETCFACGVEASSEIKVNGESRLVCAACSSPDAIARLPYQRATNRQMRDMHRVSRQSHEASKPKKKLKKLKARELSNQRRWERQAHGRAK